MTSPKSTRKNKADFTLNDETIRLLFANHPIPMWIYDLKTLAFLEINDAALEKYGYTRDEFLALTIKDIRPKEDVERLVNTLEQKRTPLNHSGEWRHLLKNGQVIDVEISTHILDFEGHKAVLVMSQDITEHKQAEEALKESEKRFATVFRANPAAIAMTRLDDNQFVDVNASWQRITGYVHTEVVGHTPQELNLWVNLEQRERLIEMVGEHGKAHGEIQLRQKSGEIRDLLMSADLIELNDKRFLLTMAQDITESKRAEENLIASEVRYRRLFEAAKDGILILDAETGVIVDVNPFLCEMLGFSHEEICGKELWELGFFKDIAESKANFVKLQEKGYIRYDDLPLEIANGRKLNVEFVSNIYNVNHHKVIQCNIRDITERKQTEQKLAHYSEHLEEMVEARTSELRETQEKLVRNEKLAVLGQLAGGVGHELRNPLAVINNALYYLKLVGANGNEKVKEYLGIIETEAHTAEKIISDLLDFARIKSVDVEVVSACGLVTHVLTRFPAAKAVNVRLEIPEDLPKFYADPRQMEQVLGNLIINACQAMSAGGELIISARQEKEMITIAVQDNGVGIPPENMEKIFEPLFTTKARGIGLGLAVSQKLAEANDGRIEVQSEAGKGTTFTVYLPMKTKVHP